MKRIGNIYEEMLSTKRIEEVFEDIKSRCKNKGNVIEFLLNKNSNINSILNDLSNYSYKFNRYSIFLIKEPKYRIIMSSSINDKIVNHLVSSYILLPSLESSLCEENTATRKGKGSAYARMLLLRHINTLKHNNKEIYVLKLDISKYFYNIDHNILLNKINNKIKDKNALKIIKDILDITNNEYINKDIIKLKENEIIRINKLHITKDEKDKKINEVNSIPLYKKDRGMCIGSMQSQILAVFFLDSIIHFIKENLKYNEVLSYVDDIIILSTDKQKILKDKILIEKEINNIGLLLNKKSNIYRLTKGIEFLGYRYSIKNNYIYIKYNINTLNRIKRNLRNLKLNNNLKYILSKNSYKGYFLVSNTSLKNNFII